MEYLYIGNNHLELISLINSFNNTIEINNLLIKDKIRKKIDIIKNMRYYGFPIMNYDVSQSKSILEKLHNIDKNKKILVYSNELNKLLGNILHNIYEYSGYQVLLSNVPDYSITIADNKLHIIDCESIYDTMIYYGGDNTVLNVIQVTCSSYLIQFADDNSARYICDLLHNKMIGTNIIKVEYVKKDNENEEEQYIVNEIDGVDKENIITADINTISNTISNTKPYTPITNLFNSIYNFILSFFSKNVRK